MKNQVLRAWLKNKPENTKKETYNLICRLATAADITKSQSKKLLDFLMITETHIGATKTHIEEDKSDVKDSISSFLKCNGRKTNISEGTLENLWEILVGREKRLPDSGEIGEIKITKGDPIHCACGEG